MANSSCSPQAITPPSFPDITILELSAIPVTGYDIPQTEVPNHGFFPPGQVDFCNVTVTFAHATIDHEVIVEVWLPAKEAWNDRVLATGGGGYQTGRVRYDEMAGVVNEGFATYTTDAGLAEPFNPVSWALDASGAIDEAMIKYWGDTSLGDMVREIPYLMPKVTSED